MFCVSTISSRFRHLRLYIYEDCPPLYWKPPWQVKIAPPPLPQAKIGERYSQTIPLILPVARTYRCELPL
jgi:hypothetical protein